MRLEHCRDRRAIPSEDQLLHGPRRPDASRAKYCDAFSAFASDTVVYDSIRILSTELDTESLRRRVVVRRIDGGEIALPLAQIEEVCALHRRSQNFKIQILRRRPRRLEKRGAVVLHLRDRGGFVPRRVINPERVSEAAGRAEARAAGRGIDEGSHHVTCARPVDPVLGRNRERGLDARVDQRIDAGAQCEKRVEIFGVGDFFEQVDRRKDRRDELYGLLPRQALRR
jgi:hypothetical protein